MINKISGNIFFNVNSRLPQSQNNNEAAEMSLNDALVIKDTETQNTQNDVKGLVEIYDLNYLLMYRGIKKIEYTKSVNSAGIFGNIDNVYTGKGIEEIKLSETSRGRKPPDSGERRIKIINGQLVIVEIKDNKEVITEILEEAPENREVKDKPETIKELRSLNCYEFKNDKSEYNPFSKLNSQLES